MRLNTSRATSVLHTHEGGHAARISPEQELRRSVMACLLWERTFYEDGIEIAERISDLVSRVSPSMVADMAAEARSEMNLRHVPLLLCRELARNGSLRAETLARVIQRPDELTEFLAIYWADGRQPLAAQVKKGLAQAFIRFDAYQLAKYDRGGPVKLRDALFLCHAKPRDEEQAEVWRKLIDGDLSAPDTWEVALSGGEDKASAWARLLSERKLGALALLRNLRNMEQAGVDRGLVREALAEANVRRVLPFRFIAAARYAPEYEADLEACLFRSQEEAPRLRGRTAVLVDVSGSMEYGTLSGRSEMRPVDAACGVAMVAREICEDVSVWTFSNDLAQVPARRGFALRDAIVASQPHQGTYLAGAIQALNERETYNRLIVFTDEQTHDGIAAPLGGARGYCINVSSNHRGVGYGSRWTHVTGWSEAVMRYIQESEAAAPS